MIAAKAYVGYPKVPRLYYSRGPGVWCLHVLRETWINSLDFLMNEIEEPSERLFPEAIESCASTPDVRAKIVFSCYHRCDTFACKCKSCGLDRNREGEPTASLAPSKRSMTSDLEALC